VLAHAGRSVYLGEKEGKKLWGVRHDRCERKETELLPRSSPPLKKEPQAFEFRGAPLSELP
jgi:hypothetical protein